MPRYRAQIHGENFLVETDGRVSRRGFITFRVVEAQHPEAAEELAVRSIRESADFRPLLRNPQENPPTMEVSELVVLDENDSGKDVPTGFIWYDSAPKRWWQFWK
jgi:hypothetical protein